MFDRYYDLSIKSGTRKKQGKRAVRREIQDRNVPLPQKWDNFITHAANKANLIARFLSKQLLLKAPAGKTIVVAGGFSDEEQVELSTPDVNTEELEGRHEEADTRMILHCVKSQASSIVVAARDTDVLVLLLAHFSNMSCTRIWMKAGTSKKPKYIPIHFVTAKFDAHILSGLPAFHSLTESDTTSFLAGHSKKSCWNVYKDNHDLLSNLGKGNLSDQTSAAAETFICKVYKHMQSLQGSCNSFSGQCQVNPLCSG